MTNRLSNKSVAILATNGFEQSELFSPKEALENAGAKVDVISLESGEIRGWSGDNWGDSITVDKVVTDVDADAYDALMLPGGVANPDRLRQNEDAVSFTRDFFTQSKPVAAICHAPQLLIEADVVRGRRVTSYSSIRRDLENAGATWEDAECVCDEGLVTSRNPDDLPAFNDKMIEEIAEGRHAAQTA